jgi:hypothetical protein
VAARRAGQRSAASARIAVAAMFDYQQAGVFLSDRKLPQDAHYLGLYFASSVLTCQLHKDNCLVLDSRIVLFGTIRQLLSSFRTAHLVKVHLQADRDFAVRNI